VTDRVVDVHAHRECAPAMEMMRQEAERAGRLPLAVGNELTKEVNRRLRIDLETQMASVDRRLADMDRMGVDVQALSLAPYQIYDWAGPEVADRVCRVINDDLAEAIAGHPDRFVGLGTVPLKDTDAAIAELERCLGELGFRGVQVATHVDGEELSSPRLERFWTRVEALGGVVLIHSSGPVERSRLTDHYFVNILGHPWEATMAVAHLIFDGVMERHPDLRVMLAHGGGFLPAYGGRLDHAYHARADVSDGLPRPPGEYLARFWFDTVVFRPDQLRYLIDRYGPDRVVLGSDYPYDMGEPDPVGLVGKLELDEKDTAAILGKTAVGLLKLDD
jgi:aminocarboxymuconate-semialdehyde decarboxylase